MVAKTTIILFFLVSCCFAQTTVTKTVGTAARDYSTIQACEDTENGDHVTADEVKVCEAYDDSDFTENVVISGGTESATQFFRITVAAGERHAGISTAGAVNNPSSDGHAFENGDSYFELEWFIIEGVTGLSSEGFRISNADGVDEAKAKYLLIHDLTGDDQDGIYGASVSASNLLVENCIIYDIARAGIYAQLTGAADTQTWTIRNTTISSCNLNNKTADGGGISIRAFNASSSVTMTSTNVIVMDTQFSRTDWDIHDTDPGTMTHTGNYNMDEDGSAPGANSQNSMTFADQFVSTTDGSEDFHLKAGNDAQNNGTTIAAVTDDIDGDARPQGAVYDIGADEAIERSCTP